MANKSILNKLKSKKARELLQQNRLAEARDAYIQICSSNRSDIDAWLTLAIINRRLNNLKDAENSCQQAAKLSPGNAQVFHIMGSIQHLQLDYDNAIDNYKKSISADQNNAETHYFLANAYRETAQFDLAKNSYIKAIELKSDFLEAMSNLGAVYIELRMPDNARKILDKANKIRPHCEQVLCNFAELALIENDIESALNIALKTLDINSDFIDALKISAKVYEQKGDYGQALVNYRKALNLQSNDENIIASIVSILEKRQQFDEARELILPLVNKNTPNAAALIAYSALSRNYGNEQEVTEIIQNALASNMYSKAAQIGLHSELGKQFDLMNNYALAFRHYDKANLIERELNHQFHANTGWIYANEKAVSDLIKPFERNFWNKLPTSTNNSRKPVFIVGMPRSGTSLIEQILATHPDVYGAGELQDIGKIVRNLNRNNDNIIEYLENIDSDRLNIASSQYLDILNGLSEKSSRVTNKMPTDFWHLGLISKLFPDASIIHMKRDPYDVCLSMFFQRFGASMTFTTDLIELGNYYRAYQRIMEYWDDVLDINILTIQYEELIENQEAMTRLMLEHCGLQWDSRCLEFHKTKRDVNTPSYDQVRKPIYKRSVERWKHYETQLKPLIDILGPK